MSVPPGRNAIAAAVERVDRPEAAAVEYRKAAVGEREKVGCGAAGLEVDGAIGR